MRETQVRRMRHHRYKRLAAIHGGPLGPGLIGHPELGALYDEVYAQCPGHPGLFCRSTGGVPRTCFVRKLEDLAESVRRGGKKRRAKERRLVEEELLLCLDVFEQVFPKAYAPVLAYTRKELTADLAYLDQVLST